MTGLPFRYDDGGRAAAGFRGDAGDCVTRAVAIGTGRPYREVYDELHDQLRAPRRRVKGNNSRSPRDGVPKPLTRKFLTGLGWTWTPTMQIGSGCTVHLAPGELPDVPVLIASVSRHLTAVVDGRIRDTHDPSRGGTRCVYGYWLPPTTTD